MKQEPQKEHHWLEQLVGDWTFESECVMGPDKPVEKSVGTESVRSLGGMWTLAEMHWGGDHCGGMVAITTLGFDTKKNRYVGTFVGSMMNFMWLYEGSLDASGKILTLDCEGPSFDKPETLTQYQDIIEIEDANHRVLRSRFLGADGTWHEFMKSKYTRK